MPDTDSSEGLDPSVVEKVAKAWEQYAALVALRDSRLRRHQLAVTINGRSYAAQYSIVPGIPDEVRVHSEYGTASKPLRHSAPELVAAQQLLEMVRATGG